MPRSMCPELSLTDSMPSSGAGGGAALCVHVLQFTPYAPVIKELVVKFKSRRERHAQTTPIQGKRWKTSPERPRATGTQKRETVSNWGERAEEGGWKALVAAALTLVA